MFNASVFGIEAVALLLWVVAVVTCLWALRSGRLNGVEAALLLVFLTVAPLIGPIVALAFVAIMRRRPVPPASPHG